MPYQHQHRERGRQGGSSFIAVDSLIGELIGQLIVQPLTPPLFSVGDYELSEASFGDKHFFCRRHEWQRLG